jgi:hypothetical protein
VIARLAIGLALAIAATASAVESTDWPPSPETLARMRELQSKISDPAATKDERESAKRDLERLMKAPGAPERKSGEAKKPARAAIEPFPSVAAPFESKPLREPPPTARLEVIDDTPLPSRKPVIDPATGRLIQPTSPGSAVDPRTGRIYQETPGGYIDPRTGRLIPK